MRPALRTRLAAWNYDAWYDRHSRKLVLVVALAALVGIWIGTAASIENGRQNAADKAESRARDAAQFKVTECLRQFNADKTQADQKVRDAASAVSAAQVEQVEAFQTQVKAFQALFVEIAREAAGGAPNEERGSRLFQELFTANAALVLKNDALIVKQAELARVRAENPIPDDVVCDI